MAKSIRVSDGIYELAASAGDAVNRSLADQIEYWARLGAALDAAGLTLAQSLQILGGNTLLKEQLLAHLAAPSARTHRRRAHRGDPAIAARKAQIEQQVEAGQRTAESLFILPRARVKAAEFTQRQPTAPGKGW
jgi:hypothetical protein